MSNGCQTGELTRKHVLLDASAVAAIFVEGASRSARAHKLIQILVDAVRMRSVGNIMLAGVSKARRSAKTAKGVLELLGRYLAMPTKTI